MNTMPNHNYFEILGVEQKFNQDLSLLDASLAQLQAQVHPDNCANATAQEKRLMMQYSTMLNEAYTVLKDPIQRACHMLELAGVEIDPESTANIPEAFLMLQMELREKLESLKGQRTPLKEFLQKTEKNFNLLSKDLAKLLDSNNPEHLDAAKELIINLQFFQKLIQEINKAIQSINVVES